MSWIYRISMKTKLAIALLPLLIALLWLAGAGMLARIDTERQMRNIEEVTRLAKSAGDVVHELQKERGLSAGYLGSKGAQFNNELTAQRSHTDDALKAFDAAMNGTDAGSLKGSVGEAIRAFQQRVSMLDETRQQITALSISAPQGVAFYTDTISTVLELVGRSTHLSHAGVIVNQMVVYYSLISMKEQAGVERALLSGIFFADHFSDGQLPRLSEVVGKQQALLAASRQLSDADGVKRIDETLALPSATRALALRQTAFEHAASGGFGVSPGSWFDAQTQRIDTLRTLENAASAQLLRTAGELASDARAGWQRFLVITLLALIVAMSFAVVVARSIHRQLYATLTAIDGMQGDLTRRLDVPGSDELSALNRAYNRAIEDIQQIVAQIKSGAVVLRHASAGIAAGNQDLAQRTDEQAASLVETAASMEQITTVITQTADNATEAERLTLMMEEEMQSASTVAHAARQSMADIQASSEQISRIVGSIDDISFQTNLLALNAAVEAARAGELGRGFAVVASEVRTLSQRCAREAGLIRELVANNMAKIGEGVEHVDASGHALDAAVANTARMRTFISDIARAAAEQSLGVSQVHEALNQLEQVTQQNASLVSEAATASQTLDNQSEAMSLLVNRFVVA
ncbi:nitrate- and nitrite sensing domain-containing protein [Cronobacter dublinensis]|nr:nitrate- and nitrite sensing domain-containing protein [Cronobacter dublinensis]EKF2293481.1 nitrate- and nitrite sensing domain-containing protein [Cronobacter dublinensis]EKF2297539.1 nitrate- and nitrite sensing domain-containing protein [Cronobacter dublinensis]EKK5270852.1 nitrate- and nitrite sensing domain-containing protein [Cronobacter dublinensis]EKM0138158.1 nitrate- and nitrite sensing domain-containing protein [Cronobacter dublinensis]